MTEKRICEAFPGGQAVYPQFAPGEGEDEAARRMNEFYLALRDAAVRYGASLCADRSEGLFQFSAEYVSRADGEGGITIEYTLRLRRRGRTEARKNLLHRWQDGWLCPPPRHKKKRPRTRHLPFAGRK